MKILVVNEKSVFYDYYSETGIGIAIYKNIKSQFLRVLRRIHHKSGLPFFSVWYTRKFNKIDDGEKEIIVFDSMLSVKPANYLKSKYPNLRVIYWHWNHIDYPHFFKHFNDNIERWSYDAVDCEEYNLKYNTQFYISDFDNGDDIKIERDCFFIGAIKSRGDYIEKCKSNIDQAGLSSLFILSDNTRKDRERKWVEYKDILIYIKGSRCVVDIVPETQYGMTLRPLEALFLKKKLITNYVDITKYDFYCPQNIFVLGKDNPLKLRDFIYSPFNEEVLKYCDYYDIKSWIRRFSIDY